MQRQKEREHKKPAGNMKSRYKDFLSTFSCVLDCPFSARKRQLVSPDEFEVGPEDADLEAGFMLSRNRVFSPELLAAHFLSSWTL